MTAQEGMEQEGEVSRFGFPIEAGSVLAFARSLHDWTIETDPRRVPLTYLQASAHFDPGSVLRPRPDQRWLTAPVPSDGCPSSVEVAAAEPSLHAEQHFEYLRVPRVGETLTVETRSGRSWEKHGRRAGRLTFREAVTEYRSTTGELVARVRSVGVETERPVGS